jgi:hypothetical protein
MNILTKNNKLNRRYTFDELIIKQGIFMLPNSLIILNDSSKIIFRDSINKIDEDLNLKIINLVQGSLENLINLPESSIIPTDKYHFVNKLYVDNLQNTKQDIIKTNDLVISQILNLQYSLDEKQDIIKTNDLVISQILNLQSSLDEKQNKLTAGDNINIVGTTISVNDISGIQDFIGFKLCSSSSPMTVSSGVGNGSSNSDQIYTDGGTPFNWDKTLFNVGGGIVGSSSYIASQTGQNFTYPYYEVAIAGYYKLSYSFGQYANNSTYLLVYVICETAALTGTVILATYKDQPTYKEYNETIFYLEVGNKVWMKRGGWNLSTGTNQLEGTDPIGYFSGVYLGS